MIRDSCIESNKRATVCMPDAGFGWKTLKRNKAANARGAEHGARTVQG
jgi:hypothetical protein